MAHRPTGATSSHPVRTRFTALHGLAVTDGRLAELATALALPVCAGFDAAEPVLALLDGPEAADRDDVWLRPFAAWIEPVTAEETGPAQTDLGQTNLGQIDTGQTDTPLAALARRAGASDLYINLTTATANELHLAGRILAALAARRPLPVERRNDLELALHEAVSNALVHGNLQVSGMKELSAAELERFSHDLVERLATPTLARRRLEVTILLEDSAAIIEVADEGAGFVRTHQDSHGASGRGLDLIATIAESVELRDGGRRIRMRFPL